ncbi:MAG: VWA domain-containing protein [Chloroflexota bacterium]
MSDSERLRRWRLLLGGGDADGTGQQLNQMDEGMDRALEALYDANRKGSLGSSAPNVARWLGDVRSYFPNTVVQVMQKDALERLGLQELLLEPEMLEAVEPDIHLVSTLLSLNKVMPNKTKETARFVVRQVVEEIERKLAYPLQQAVDGSLNRTVRNRRPRHKEIDWQRTIQANLKHYQPSLKAIIPETKIGFGRKGSSLQDIILCIDQSGSMAASVIYASIFGAVLASMRTVNTSLVLFDTAVVDMTDQLDDPVELLFGAQLGGGTDINRALTYCQGLIQRPQETIFVLITDLYEGGNAQGMLKQVASLVNAGVQVVTLLALDDQGAPSYNRKLAAKLAELNVPAFACTPDLFPDLMATAIKRQDIGEWLARQGMV